MNDVPQDYCCSWNKEAQETKKNLVCFNFQHNELTVGNIKSENKKYLVH